MSGRIYVPQNSQNPRQQQKDSHSRRPPIESPPRHRLSSDHPTIHHREIQSILADNQRLAATHVALKQELAVAVQDLRHFSAAVGNIKSELDAEVREVYEKAIKMEAEVRLIDEMSADLVQVKSDVQKLCLERKECNEKLERIQGDLVKEKAKKDRVSEVKLEIETMRKEIQKGRAAIEYEKKVYAANIEQGQAMEKSMMSMVHEIEKLQAELANADKKALAVAAAAATNTTGAGYAAGYGNPDMGYGGNVYPGPYAMHPVQGGVDPRYGNAAIAHGPHMQHAMVDPRFVPGPAPHGPYDMQHPNNLH